MTKLKAGRDVTAERQPCVQNCQIKEAAEAL